jgi:hypothetical protein
MLAVVVIIVLVLRLIQVDVPIIGYGGLVLLQVEVVLHSVPSGGKLEHVGLSEML